MRSFLRPLPALLCCLLAFTALLPQGRAQAQNKSKSNAITVYGGWRGSSGFSDAINEQKINIRDSSSISAALDLDLEDDGTRQWQLFASHQKTSLNALSRSGTTTSTLRLPITVTHVHVGGTYFFGGLDDNYGRGEIGRGPYAVGGIGATLLRPTSDGYSSETRPSLNLGLGYMQPLGAHLALKVEGRAYFTLIGGSTDLFCSGGCTLSIQGSTFQQYEMLIGLSLRF